ncbi:hypothetical protein AOLI_G00104430 [Acnodon oligacanthus]
MKRGFGQQPSAAHSQVEQVKYEKQDGPCPDRDAIEEEQSRYRPSALPGPSSHNRYLRNVAEEDTGDRGLQGLAYSRVGKPRGRLQGLRVCGAENNTLLLFCEKYSDFGSWFDSMALTFGSAM